MLHPYGVKSWNAYCNEVKRSHELASNLASAFSRPEGVYQQNVSILAFVLIKHHRKKTMPNSESFRELDPIP